MTESRLTDEQAGRRMGLTPARVRLLVSQEEDRLELARYKQDSIPAARIREFVERELQRQGLSRAELAHYVEMKQIDLERQLGYGLGKNGRRQQRIGIPAASRLVIALGRAPIELEGC